MTNKEKYAQFCEKTYVPVFSKPWWMDAAVGKENWDVFLVEHDGTFFSAMPYYLTKRGEYRLITKAPNTQNNGILFCCPEGQKLQARLSFQEKCIERTCDFIESLVLDKYEQQFHYSFQNWLPFFWRRYKEITRYTYVLDTQKSMDEIESDYTSNLRNTIRKSSKLVSLHENDMYINEFYVVNQLSFTRQKKEIPYSLDFVKRIYEAGKANDACKILSAVDNEGHIHSVALLIWDERSVYYLLNGTNPEYKSSQANYFLIHEGIKFAKSKGLLFDFEGSVIRPIERAFREFGGEPKPYFRIYKTFNRELLRKEQEAEAADI